MKRVTSRLGPAGLAIALAATTVSCTGNTGIEIADAWGRPSPSVATAGAFFMTLNNNGTVDDDSGGSEFPGLRHRRTA